MNHADRERLSNLLRAIDDEIGEFEFGYTVLQSRIDDARAIVDQPTGWIDARTHEPVPGPDEWADQNSAATGPPNPQLDAFLTEPIHEYRPRDNQGNHRAPSRPLRTAITLTIAAVALIGLTAANTPHGRPDGPGQRSRAAKPPSEASQTWFRSGNAPWKPGRGPGTYGNGLGVATP